VQKRNTCRRTSIETGKRVGTHSLKIVDAIKRRREKEKEEIDRKATQR
jgi:hypothetical protein